MNFTARESIVQLMLHPELGTTEATIQSNIYALLTFGDLNLSKEQVRLETGTNDGTKRRIDVEIGHVAIEVKRDLRPAGIMKDGEAQLGGYVKTRTESTGARYVGVLTDGIRWHLYNATADSIREVSELDLSQGADPGERLAAWLEAVLSTQTQVKPTPEEIVRRLGANSPAHLLDVANLREIYEMARARPEVMLKRQLWGKLLRTAFGSAFDDSETLFINHTVLVLSAEIIAHAVLTYNVGPSGGLTAKDLTLGTTFANAQIHGVVQGDFFDWVLHAPGGETLITDLARRVAQFDWTQVEHDVLKVLYESVIEQPERKRLGEYYTPDWLADRVVASAVTDPLNQRVMDPACGSGTFLFHAVRVYLAAAENAGLSTGDAVLGATQHVVGVDVHPVAVTLARVTYLLAIGATRLADNSRGPISVPVYLGDSLQWEQPSDVLTYQGEVTIGTSGTDLVDDTSATLFGEDLVFPKSVLHDAGDFDRLVSVMTEKAADTSKRGDHQIIGPVLKKFGVPEADIDTLESTFGVLRRLHGEGSDGIWGYYVRNLVRPLWLSQEANRVDVLVGNPPWLRYAEMTPGMMTRFTELSRERGLLTGKRGISARDLSTLFVVRACELYLRSGGHFAFVMPQGTLTRQPHEGFRAGVWNNRNRTIHAQFGIPWDLTASATGFPNHACVISGTVSQEPAKALPTEVEIWKTTGERANVTWPAMEARLTVTRGLSSATSESDVFLDSPYKKRFRNGAQLQPRMLLFVDKLAAGPLGAGKDRINVASHRTVQEKDPWKQLPTLHGVVERTYVRPVYLGENVVPFGTLPALHAVLPIKHDNSTLLARTQIDEHDGLAHWWAAADALRDEHKKSSDDSSLLDRIDFHGQLSAQFPTANRRVVYTKAGNSLSAAIIDDPQAVIEGKLYWAPVNSHEEGRYLTAILNSSTLLGKVSKYQAVGLFGARDIDKNVFRAAFPFFDAGIAEHSKLSTLAGLAEMIAAQVIDSQTKRASFQVRRRQVREALDEAGISEQIEALVAQVIPA